MRTRARAGDSSVLDVAYIATTFGVSESDVQALIEAPTTELVSEFLLTLTEKGKEYDGLKAEKLKVDVELDNTVRTSETKLKAQKNTVTRVQKEVEELRTKLNESEAAREALAAEIERLRSSSSGTTAETQALRQRIDTLEESNRDALALIETKSTEKDRVASELSEQHSKLLSLRREISQLEEQNQALENAASSQKFKEQSLQHEIDLLKKSNEWHLSELQTRGQEHTKFRKERNATISSLERELEDSKASVEALKRSENTLRQRLNEAQSKAEDAFARIAALQEEAARKEQDFRTELDGSKRLADLQAQNAATHKSRLQEVQAQIDRIKEDAAEEIGRLQAEVETERGDKEAAESKIAELELHVERLEQQPRISRPGTPIRNGHGDPQTPGRGGSPSAIPGSMRKVVNGLSFTQLYTKYTEAQEELENERRRTIKLSTALDEMITEVETRKPEIEELKEDQERLENEVLNFSRLLDESNESRDSAIREAQRWQGEAESAAREGQILRQQLRDLSTQVKILLVEIQSRDQGLGALSAEERLELERAARGELEDGSLDGMTSTGRLISERLVVFREVSELQAKNEQLLRLTRELGDKMEGEEAQEQARQSAADAEEVEALRQQLERYKDELQATTTTIDSYMKERDMFRRMLQHRGQIAPDTDLHSFIGQSTAPQTPQRNSVGPPATPRSKDVEDLNKLLKEQQAFFDQFRTESSTDRRMLKEQVDALAREKSALQTELARAQSNVTLSSERYEMLQSNFVALRNENSELQKRAQQMAEQAAKQDLRTQQVAEDLVEARSLTESLRNENANAKAEKDFQKRIEIRLSEENKSLADERSRLNKMVADLQNLQNERELSDCENRRRMQSRVEALENELTDVKKKLASEVEDHRKAILRREYEEGQSRTRIDDLVKSLGIVREELVAAKTSRDQLQARVDELKIELRAAEEKVVALQPRPTPRPDPAQNSGQPEIDEDDELPAEQRLALQVSELRRDLELSKADLESARLAVEQYKSISQATEEELASLSQTSQQYHEEVDQLMADKDAKISELEQRIEDITSELGTTNTELSELRAKADDGSRLLAEQKADFESEVTRLRDEVDHLEADKVTIQGDVKAQAEIAQQAQQSYEEELQKHAEAAKSLQGVRKEYNELRTEVVGIKAEAEAAKTSLERAEESWAEQRELFERELEEINRRRQDVDEQNKLLHKQLESFSEELAALRQARAAAAGQQHENTTSGSGAIDNYQEVINFLRREKEIVDVQYELSTQEAKRLQHQLDHANSQLEETRQKLADERRQSTEKASAESSTSKLMQTINELNLYRESTTTLRNEARAAREQVKEKSEEVERLLAQIEPLKARVGELEAEFESKDSELKLVQDDRDHWRERTQNIISKYDRVDPAELEEMKKKLGELEAEKSNLEAEKARLEAEQAPLKEQVAGVDARVASEVATATAGLAERLEKFKVQAKDQDRKRLDRIRDVTSEKEAVATELKKVQDDLAATAGELEQIKIQLEQSTNESEQARAAVQSAQAASRKTPDDVPEEGQIQEHDTSAEQSDEHAALHARISEAEANASEHSGRADQLSSQVQTLQARVHELELQVNELQQQLETARSSTGGDGPPAAADHSETLEKLQQDLATAQQEVETLRANASHTNHVEHSQLGLSEKSVVEQVAEETAKLKAEFEQQHELAKKQMQEDYVQKLENAKASMNRKLSEIKAKQRDELLAQHEQELQRLKDEHDTAIKKLKYDHQVELEKLSKDCAVAVTKASSDAAAGPTETKPEVSATKASASDVSQLITDENVVRELIKSNAHVKAILSASVKTSSDKITAKLKETVAAKDAEIRSLEEALKNANNGAAADTSSSADTDKHTWESLEQQLELAKQEREAAVKQAVDAAEKKFRVQINMKDIAQAKVAVVQKAALETPEKPVKEVWEIASKARPAPKPAAVADMTSTSSAKPAVPASPSSVQPQASSIDPTLGQSSSSTKLAPNAQAAAFTPNAPTSSPADLAAAKPTAVPKAVNAGTGPAALRSIASGIPQRGGGAAGTSLPRPGVKPPSRQSSIGGSNSLQAPRALSSGLPRGGGAPRGAMTRGGLRGGANAANAGQKRAHEGAEGGDVKRTRGGGPTGGS